MGLILLAAILQNLGSIVGEDLSHRLMNRLGALGELLAFGVPPAAAMLALTAALGWSVAFLSEFLRNKNFLTVRTGRVLEVHRGLFTLRSCLVQADRIDVYKRQVYGDLVCDVLPFEELVNRGIREFRIVFRHEARYGEELGLQLFHDREEDCWYVTGHRADGPCFEAQVVLNDTEQSEDSVR